MLTEEDQKQIGTIVEDAMENRRLMWRQQREGEVKSNKVTNLYLITFSGHHIALPDERGRAIHNACVYARIELDKDKPVFFGGRAEVVAYGDGKLLKTPVGVILTGGSIVSMAEVPDGFLENAD